MLSLHSSPLLSCFVCNFHSMFLILLISIVFIPIFWLCSWMFCLFIYRIQSLPFSFPGYFSPIVSQILFIPLQNLYTLSVRGFLFQVFCIHKSSFTSLNLLKLAKKSYPVMNCCSCGLLPSPFWISSSQLTCSWRSSSFLSHLLLIFTATRLMLLHSGCFPFYSVLHSFRVLPDLPSHPNEQIDWNCKETGIII